ncbi:hypothetical protein D3C81_1687700 [compost metagenome]
MQRDAVLQGLGQQDGDIRIVRGRFQNVGEDVLSQPLAELQFAPCRVAPGHDFVTHDDGGFQCAQRRVLAGCGGDGQQRALQSAQHGVIGTFGNDDQQVDIAEWLQATVECGAVEMDAEQVRRKLLLEHIAGEGELVGDGVWDMQGHEGCNQLRGADCAANKTGALRHPFWFEALHSPSPS